MSKTYVFAFPGTREDFLRRLDCFHHSTYSSGTCYYLDDYLVKLVDNEIHFGVARGGHSGGYWFVPTVIDFGDKVEFCGTIRYVGPEKHQGPIRKAIDNLGIFLLVILMLPIMLLIRLYHHTECLVRKICNRQKPKEKTNEERLRDLMECYLGCISKESLSDLAGEAVSSQDERDASVFPLELDHARVLYYTPKSNYGAITYPNGEVADKYCYLAICQYPNSDEYYLFCCNENYEVASDWVDNSIEACMRFAASCYKENATWMKAP